MTELLNMRKVQDELSYIQKAVPGDPSYPLARTVEPKSPADDIVSSFNSMIKMTCEAAHNYDSMNAFFDRDNVGLPGVALYFKVAAVDARNTCKRIQDWLNKRGAHPKLGDVSAPPTEWHSKERSDVTEAFMVDLAMEKGGFSTLLDMYKVIAEYKDPHAEDFITDLSRQKADKIRCKSYMVTHLKLIDGDKHAIKNFDRCISQKIVPMAAAAGLESTLPNRLVKGAVARVCEGYNIPTEPWEKELFQGPE